MQVRIYFNLRNKKLSVQTKINKTWKVTSYVDKIYLTDVRFRVSEAGRQRVLKNKRKNVHAYIYGTVTGFLPDYGDFYSARYNPYELEKFQCQNKNIDKSDYAILNGRELFVNNPR